MLNKYRIFSFFYLNLAVRSSFCNGKIFVFRKINMDRIGDKNLSAFNKLQRSNTSSDFCTGINIINSIITYRRTILQIIKSASVSKYFFMILLNYRIRSRYSEHRQIVIKKVLQSVKIHFNPPIFYFPSVSTVTPATP
jgi:hypothetical protein